MKILFALLTLLLIDCSDSGISSNQESERKDLDKLAKEIKSIANGSVCSDEFVCDFIGFGSKPCGGNWEYIVYSSSIDTKDFLNKVKNYNELEKKYNQKWNAASDCMFAMPPDDVICENGKCKAVYN